jgi:hypothetical protein
MLHHVNVCWCVSDTLKIEAHTRLQPVICHVPASCFGSLSSSVMLVNRCSRHVHIRGTGPPSSANVSKNMAVAASNADAPSVAAAPSDVRDDWDDGASEHT